MISCFFIISMTPVIMIQVVVLYNVTHDGLTEFTLLHKKEGEGGGGGGYLVAIVLSCKIARVVAYVP